MKLVAPSIAVLLMASGAAACGDAGDAPLSIEGSIVGESGDLRTLQIGLLWTTETGGCLDARTRVAVPGGSPATFRLTVTEAPPADAQFVTAMAAHPPVARAHVVAFDGDSRALGYATDASRTTYGVFYARGVVPGNDEGTGFYGGTPLRPGYQLGRFDRSRGEPVLRLAGDGERVQIGIMAIEPLAAQSSCASR